MNPKIKNIFVNPEMQYLRAFWRVSIFLIIVAAITASIGMLIGIGLKQVPFLNVNAVKVFLSYLLLTIATWIPLRFIDKRPFESIGLTFKGSWLKELSQGLLIGSGMISIVFIIEYFSGMVYIEFFGLTFNQAAPIFVYSLCLYASVGYGEELMFRGYILQITAEGTNRLIAGGGFAILFALAHLGNPNVSVFGLINVGLAGVWLTIAYYKTNALWLPIGLHISWNFFQGFVYSFPVSGTTSAKEQIGKAIVNGPDWITGGAFGPEGGAITTVLLIASSAFIYFSPWFKTSDGVWRFETWRENRKNELQAKETELPLQ
jgi:uncharacterized protein